MHNIKLFGGKKSNITTIVFKVHIEIVDLMSFKDIHVMTQQSLYARSVRNIINIETIIL